MAGSSIALFASKSGKDNELNAIEKIELGAHLPHPMFNGEWIKRSKEGQKFCLWANYDENNFTDYLQLAKDMGARILCRHGGYSSNWGHFDLDRKVYPGGNPALLRDSKRAKEAGVATTLYTLTTFLTEMTEREPYLAPIPDDRLQTWAAEASISKDINQTDKNIFLKNSKLLVETLKKANSKVIRVDNEIIEFEKFEVNNNEILAQGCTRGAFMTTVADHKTGASAKLMYVSGYHNFYPGTIGMSNEVADRLAKIVIETDQDNFVIDGFESCLEAGYGCYTGNVFMQNFYKKCQENKKETLVTSSNFSQYTWHNMSHESWGENDSERGFRGSMLDYRISRQGLLQENLMPNKLGQYHPGKASVEDLEWVMALATGWNSGVDFTLDINQFKKNPHSKEIVDKLRLWTDARSMNAFTEAQKMALRQTDVQYKLSRKADGSWDLAFDKFWQYDKLKLLPASAIKAKVVNSGNESVKPRSIDWFWTHNPGIYDEVLISDDLIHKGGVTPTSWTINYNENDKYQDEKRYLQFVLRLPKDAPCGIKNIKISANGEELEIPVLLNPGEYIAIPHLNSVASVYNSQHKVIREKTFRKYLPTLKKGSTNKISVSCDPVDTKQNITAILNITSQNGFFYQQ
ncbi:hypothetical protein [Pedobacter sp. NJ-S-72]